MSRLQPGQTPGQPIMARSKSLPKTPEIPPVDHEPDLAVVCDRCGYSKIDGQPIAYAKARVYVRRGTLNLCGHHLRTIVPILLERGYYFRSLV